MTKLKATLKSYPLADQQKDIKYWIEGQAIKRVTVQLTNNPTQEQMDSIFQKVTDLGFGNWDKRTFVSDVDVRDLPSIQKSLSEIFDLTYAVN
jgi:hypothetical protein